MLASPIFLSRYRILSQNEGIATRLISHRPVSQVVVADGGLKVEDTPPSPALLAHMLTKLEWPVFRDTAREVTPPPHT